MSGKTLEQALVDVGTDPLVKSPYSKAIVAIVNASINDPLQAVTPMHTGGAVLTLLYQLPDATMKANLLNKDLGGVRDKDSYRTVVLGFSSLIAVLAVAMAIGLLMGTPDSSHSSANLLEKIISSIFDLLKLLLGVKDESPSP